MKLYLVSQDAHDDYDTYDSFVCVAGNEDVARHMDPRFGKPMVDKDWNNTYGVWCSSPDQVKVKYLGEAVEGSSEGVVCASFNAG